MVIADPELKRQVPARLIEFLDKEGVSYELIHHPIAYASQELAAIENVKGRHRAKVIVVQSQNGFAIAVLGSDQRIDLVKLGKIIGSQVSLAEEVQIRKLFPDCAVGAAPPFGQLYNVPTYVDQRLSEGEIVVFEAGTHTDAIKILNADYERIVVAQFVNFASPGN